MSAHTLLWQLASFGIKSTAILVLVALACAVFHRLGASYRHLFRTAGFCAILVLPILGVILPRQTIAILPAPASAAALPRLASFELATPTIHVQSKARTEEDARTGASVRREPRAEITPVAHRASPESVALWTWALGAAIVLGQYALSLCLLCRSAAKAVKSDPGLYETVSHAAGVSRKWSLLLGDVAGMPSPKTWGVFRPVVAMPAKSTEWPVDQFETVLMHELVHAQTPRLSHPIACHFGLRVELVQSPRLVRPSGDAR